MQTYKIKLTDRFQQELHDILGFIADSSPSNALHFRNELYAQMVRLNFMPFRCRKHFSNANSVGDNIRDLIFKGYVVVFLVDKMSFSVEILGIYKANKWQL